MTEQIPLDVYGISDVGPTRENNEDNILYYPPQALNPEQIATKGLLYLVADGVGGHQAGEVASNMVANLVRDHYYSMPNGTVESSLRAAIEEANRQIYREANSNDQRYGMASTVTAIVLHTNNTQLTIANVGDSRTYLIRQGQPYLLTTDHTWVNEQVTAGVLTPEEAKTHPQRNVVTRSMGSKFEVQVDVSTQGLEKGDALLLCSDGLSEVVSDAEMTNIVLQNGSAETAVKDLIKLTYKRNGPDNVTALVVNVGKRSAPPPVVGGKKTGRRGNFIAFFIVAPLILLVIAFFLFNFLQSDNSSENDIAATTAVAQATSDAPTSATQTNAVVSTDDNAATPNAQLNLLTPANDAVLEPGKGLSLSWEWPLVQGQQFKLIAQSNQGNSIERQLTENELKLTATELPPGSYTWLVLVEDASGKELTRSGTGYFYIQSAPTATPLPSETVTATSGDSTVAVGETPTPIPTTSQTEEAPITTTSPVAPPPGAPLPAPTLLGPDNNASFTSRGAEITLQWREAERALTENEYYVLLIKHRDGDDRTWLKETSYGLQANGKGWLYGLTDHQGALQWRVIIAQKQTDEPNEDPANYATSPPSETRTLIWREGSDDGGGGDSGDDGDGGEGTNPCPEGSCAP